MFSGFIPDRPRLIDAMVIMVMVSYLAYVMLQARELSKILISKEGNHSVEYHTIVSS